MTGAHQDRVAVLIRHGQSAWNRTNRFTAWADIDPELLPATENLHQCQRRTLPYWQETLQPRIAAGRRLLIVSHGNTLRGLVMHLDGISPGAMGHSHCPFAEAQRPPVKDARQDALITRGA